MKRFFMIIVAVLPGGLLVCSCGYGGGTLDGGMDGRDGNGGGDQQSNECTQAAEIQMQSFDQACAPRSTVCCFCQCWYSGRQWYDTELWATSQTCSCTALSDPPPCEDQYLTSAQECLADQTACREQAEDLVLDAEFGLCTNTTF